MEQLTIDSTENVTNELAETDGVVEPLLVNPALDSCKAEDGTTIEGVTCVKQVNGPHISSDESFKQNVCEITLKDMRDMANSNHSVGEMDVIANSDSDSEVSSSSSDWSDSSDEPLNVEIRTRNVDLVEEINALKSTEPPKVKGEILPCELPPVEDLNVALPEEVALQAVGKISQIMEDNSVVIQSYRGIPALDHETVLFLSHRQAIGKVEETFGPVPNPLYVVRFNSKEHIDSKGVELHKEVFYAPSLKDMTSYVFMSALQKLRGSDASWSNDTEPPSSCLDYSDDEEEKMAKKALKNKNKETPQKSEERKRPAAEMSHGGNLRGRNRWHNESRRVNVLPFPNPEFEGWNAAVNRMGSRGQNMRPAYPNSPMTFRQPADMNQPPFPRMDLPSIFNRPPYMAHHTFNGNFMANSGPEPRWSCHPSLFNNGMARFGQPPPPPPP